MRSSPFVAAICLCIIGCSDGAPPTRGNDTARQAAVSQADPTVWLFESVVSPDDWLAMQSGLTTVRRLEFLHDEQQTLDWSSLAEANQLTRFRCDGNVDGDLANALAELTNLTLINLPRTNWGEDEIASLTALTLLTNLRLGGQTVDDATVTRIATEFPELRYVHLIDVSMTDVSLDALAGNERLESLYLDDVDVSDEALSRLVEARPDLHLHIDQLHLDDDPNRHDHEAR